jgi:hypothetical protein
MYMRICIDVHIFIYVYVNMYLLIHMYTYIYVYIYIIYIYIYIGSESSLKLADLGYHSVRTIQALSESLNESKNHTTDPLNEEILFEILKKSIENMDNNLLAPFMYVDSLRLLIHHVMKGSIAMTRYKIYIHIFICIYMNIYI